MPSAHHLVAFAITAFIIIVVPGPSVLFIVGRALAVGRREAVLTMVGNTVGASVLLVLVSLGLGTLILYANGNLDTARVFSILLVLAATGLSLHGLIGALRRRLLFWDAARDGAYSTANG